MTLIGKHTRNGDYVSQNFSEGGENGNVDKIRAALKFQVSNIIFRFKKTNNMKPFQIKFVRTPCCPFFLIKKKILLT